MKQFYLVIDEQVDIIDVDMQLGQYKEYQLDISDFIPNEGAVKCSSSFEYQSIVYKEVKNRGYEQVK